MTFPTHAPSIAGPTSGPLIREAIVNGERLIEMGASVLVASKTTSGGWYEVRQGSCQCSGYRYRGWCRHLIAVMSLEAQIASEVAADLDAIEASKPAAVYHAASGHTFTADEIAAQQEAARVKVQAVLDAGDDDYLSSESIKARREAAAQPVAVGQHPSQTERWL